MGTNKRSTVPKTEISYSRIFERVTVMTRRDHVPPRGVGQGRDNVLVGGPKVYIREEHS